MSVIIPTVGKGSRLKPFTDSMPKALVPVGGISLLQRLLESMPESTHVVILVNPSDTAIRSFLQKRDFPLTIDVREWEAQGTLRDLWRIAQDSPSPFIYLDCDVLVPRKEFYQFVQTAAGLLEGGDMVVGITADPPIPTARPIWVVDNQNGSILITGRAAESTGLQTVPTYCMTAQGIEIARRCLDQGVVSLATFLTAVSQEGVVRPFYYSRTRNINTAEDQAAAEGLFPMFEV